MASNDTTPLKSPASGAPTMTAQVEGQKPSGPLLQRPEGSCVFVIFGASGGLTSRKLIPATCFANTGRGRMTKWHQKKAAI
jgi:hypothetical protein